MNVSLRAAARCLALAGLLPLLGLATGQTAQAGGVVSTPTEAALDAALQGGGTVTLACDGVIIVTGTKVIGSDTTLDGTGHAITISGGDSVRILQATSGVTLNLTHLTLSHAKLTQDAAGGGAVDNEGGVVTAVGVVFDSNAASGTTGSDGFGGDSMGGAVNNTSSGTFNATDCTFSNNSASGGVGAQATGDAYGGAIDSQGTLNLTNCTLNGNSCNGGIYGHGGAVLSSGPFTAVNCTFYGNAANGNVAGTGGSSYGGGLVSYGSSTLTNCTFFRNGVSTAGQGNDSQGGALYNGNTDGTQPLALQNTLVAGSLTGGDAAGVITDGGHNICDDATCAFGSGTSLNSADPKLNALANNGGPTQTCSLQAGSPAIDNADPALAPPADQRHAARSGAPDVGAYEYNGVLPGGGPTSHTQILWDNTNGTASLWRVNSDNTFTSAQYGPYAGWTARAVSEAPDGTLHLLWTNTNGQASLWNIPASGAATSTQYGPYTGYAAVSLSTGGDNVTHLLWNRSDGQSSIWNVNAGGALLAHGEYGPYAHWTANAVASGATVTDILWTNTNGTMAGYRFAASGALTTQTFGPYTGWGAYALSVGPDDIAHPMWDNQNGMASLWSAAFLDSSIAATSYGPYPGWYAKAVATGPDNISHLLWDNVNGQASLWSIPASGGFTSTQYGPYSGWQAVAVSAGP